MNTLRPALIKHDMRLQARYGIYAAYSFVITFYVLALVFLAPYLPDWVPGLIIATDPSVVGFFFLGALMLLEKSEGTGLALAASPVSAADYLLSKTLTLTGMSTLAVAILVPFLHREANPFLLLPTTILISIQFIGVGVPVAYMFKTVTGYLMGAAGVLTPFMLPAGFAFLAQMPIWLAIYPPIAEFRLVLAATGATENSIGEIVFMLAMTLVGAIAAQIWAHKKLKQEFGK